VFFNKESKNFLATEKPVMVIVQEQDSVYVAADTIYSGLMKDLKQLKKGYITAFDTVKNKISDGGSLGPAAIDSSRMKPTTLQKDSVSKVLVQNKAGVTGADSTKKTDTIRNTTQVSIVQIDSVSKNDTIIVFKKSQAEIDTTRFITAFRNVRIFNDSIQAMGDSLFYSGVDSIFELYYNPIAWSKGSQITGDTIFIYTENRKPKRLYVFENGMMVQNVLAEKEFYNQIKGRTINGYFTDGELRDVEANGSAESIYYVLDDDSAYVGMNRTTADRINLYFSEKEIKKVLFTRSVKGKTYPIKQVPADEKKLPDFQWLDEKRPKSKLELFY
jgi:lipopolysaccharide export system protein LptA